MAFVVHFLGRRLAYTYEITTLDPLRHRVMRTAEGPFAMETPYTLAAIDPQHTKFTLRNRGEPTGFSALVAPLRSLAMRRANTQDLHALKALLEAQSSS
ncbi:MAG: hypothetical protein Q8Q09_19165 [Deltaproteobacteria bacterium]|nr:hypothetical protein [Deltaproteobacteria bacterium]